MSNVEISIEIPCTLTVSAYASDYEVRIRWGQMEWDRSIPYGSTAEQVLREEALKQVLWGFGDGGHELVAE